VIAGRSGGVPDAVQDGVTGLLVDPEDNEAVAAAIITVLREPALATSMGAKGREWVEAEMNWSRAGDEFEQAMDKFFPRVVCDGVFSERKEAV
jgi:phosphatidylinositol alpha-1,6-mannosyltransferase